MFVDIHVFGETRVFGCSLFSERAYDIPFCNNGCVRTRRAGNKISEEVRGTEVISLDFATAHMI
jgi:hypothetical protein